MSTVVVRGRTIASDSLVTLNHDISIGTAKKIFQIKNEFGQVKGHIGFVGDYSVVAKLGTFAESKARIQEKSFLDKKVDSLILWNDGSITLSLGKSISPFKSDYYAIGSGANFALGALAQGATAEEAILVAMKFDQHSGGELQKGIINKNV